EHPDAVVQILDGQLRAEITPQELHALINLGILPRRVISGRRAHGDRSHGCAKVSRLFRLPGLQPEVQPVPGTRLISIRRLGLPEMRERLSGNGAWLMASFVLIIEG